MKCLDCGNTTNFRVAFTDWSLVCLDDDGTYGISESLDFYEDENQATECHKCESTNVEIEVSV